MKSCVYIHGINLSGFQAKKWVAPNRAVIRTVTWWDVNQSTAVSRHCRCAFYQTAVTTLYTLSKGDSFKWLFDVMEDILWF